MEHTDPGEACVFPVSFAQAQLWFLDQLQPGTSLYNMPAATRIRGEYDVALLGRCLDEIVLRHETLRTTFRTEDGQPVQVIAPSLHIPITVVDLSTLAEAERQAEARRLGAEEANLPFDLSRGPLLRVKVLKLAEDDRVLMVTFHHIISDGWSLTVLFHELSELYQAFGDGLPSPLSELPIQYADFAVWQRETLQGEALAGHLDYWREHLRGAPALLELPTDRPRPPVQSFRGRTHTFRLPLAQQEAVHALGRKLAATPFMILLAAYAVLVSRRARLTDLVIGAATAGRTQAELENLIGLFVNLLALRLDLSGAPSFRELVARVREVTLNAHAHQDLAFGRLVDGLAPERSPSHNPVVQVTFGLHNTPFPSPGASAEKEDDPAPSPATVFGETAKFDLNLVMMESPRGLLASFEYNTDLFDGSTIERMAGELTVLLTAATAEPERKITELPLLSAEERSRLITRWNDTDVPLPADRCLHEIFAEQAAQTPEVEAVVCGEQVLTYRALSTRVNQLAHHLRSLGVGPEVMVGICLHRSARMIVAALGVLTSGGAYVPLDPAYPRERLAFMLEDAGVSVLLTETAVAASLPAAHGATVICLDAIESLLAVEPEDLPRTGVTHRNLAYMIYTSGSTGKPKGVLVEHRGLANQPVAQVRYHGIRPGDRMLQLAPLSFDTAVWEIAVALTAGATLVVATSDEQLPGPGLARLIRERRVTAMAAAPSLIAALPAEESLSLPLRVLSFAGEPCPAELVKRWVAPGRRLFNSYGPTEATIWATSAADIDGSRPPPIGLPIANAQVHVLDEALEPVPTGVAGEVFIGGAGVARGYHRRPDLTAQRFLSDPFRGEPGARLYRTGDLARRFADGSLEFVGRADEQIKLRGYRIEVGEIEAVLEEHPAIEAAAVICRETSPGHRELVGCLVEDPAFHRQGGRRDELRRELHEEWQTIFDETYRDKATPLDSAGWTSSYTGSHFSAAEMEDWAGATASRILSLGPARVLEVGCGTGLILRRVAPRVERYVGVDFSAAAIERLAAEVQAQGLRGVHLERRDAGALSGLGERGFDVIVLDSVIQYFPSLDFLMQVITAAVPLLAERGSIFLGDVRSLPHLAVQHASVQIHRAAASASRADIRAAASRRRALEQELAIHPEAFCALPTRLPGIAAVEVLLRRGRHRNEMSKFRYDVVIRKGSPLATITPVRVEASLEALRRALTGQGPAALLCEDLENRRVSADLRALRWLDGESDDPLPAAEESGVDPEDVIALGESLGYRVSLSFSGGDPLGRFDALLVRRDVEGQVSGFPRAIAAADLANDPLAGRRERALLQSVRDHLERRLPAYMVPASFVRLDALPLTPHGKVDRRALLDLGRRELPAPGLSGSDAVYRAPRNAVEETLAQIWASVLRLPRVGIHDNFFEIGGDSILSIQIVSRAQQAGIALTPRQMFQHQTIAKLAAVAGAMPSVLAEQGPVTGEAPLTPVQRWWLEQDQAEPHHFNQSILLMAREPLDTAALSRAVGRVVDHHDALRLRLTGTGDAARLMFAEPGGPVPFQRVDLSTLSETERVPALQAAAAEAQASLDLRAGPVLRAVLFDLGKDTPARLLLTVHHLAVDAVSWRILLDDLWTAYQGAPTLPAKTTSFKRWAERLAEHAASEAVHAELDRWRDVRGAALPVDHQTGPNDCASARHVTVSLSPAETERLLREAPAAYSARIDELLVTAFAVALARWTGSPAVRFDLEGHGREEIFPDVDLTRTVGWFTVLYPVALQVGDAAPPDAVTPVQRALAAIPGRGIGHGLLRYLRADTKEALRALPASEICFNYLGQIDRSIPEAAPIVPAPEPAGADRSPLARRTHLIEVNACVAGGSLHVDWAYSEHRHQRATVERLAESFVEALRALLARAVSAERIEDRYPLSPLQEGILFHARTSPGDPVYLVQTAWTMEGDLDAAAFTAAFQALVERHSILRTSFAWEGLPAPVQRVHAGVVLPIEQRDLRDLAPEDQAQEVARCAADELRRGFDLTAAPLMRVTVLRLRDGAHRLIWTLHHVILDGWSTPILLEELFTLYEARRAGRALAHDPPRPFRDYIDWLSTQDRARSASFWKRELSGFTAPTPFGVDRAAPLDDGGSRAGWQRLSIEADQIVAFVQRRKLTLSTLVQGAWALLLSRYSGEDDVLFGATVSGRSAPIQGIFRMVGLFINTLPVRARAPRDERVEAWLADLQGHLADLREHEHSPLVEVMAQSDLPRGSTLFESLVVVENYPVQTGAGSEGGLRITDVGHFDDTPYPLTLLAAHRGALHLELGYDRRRFDDDTVARMIGHLATLLRGLVQHPEATLGEIPLMSEDERRLALSVGNDTVAPYPREACLHDLFEARVDAAPDAPALVFQSRSLTYAELRARAHGIARRLRARGVGPGMRVGICAGRSPEAIAGILGVILTGGAYVPLDPAYPAELLSFMIEDAHLAVILADARAASRVPDRGVAVERLDAGDPQDTSEIPLAAVTAADPAYVVYTSGSTGRPKGVLGTHRGMVNRCAWMWAKYPFRPGEVCCQKTSLSFVDSIWEIFGPLLQGVPLVILPDATVHDLSAFIDTLASARVTRVVLVPSLLRALLDISPELGERLPDLTMVTSSGEALSADLATRFHQAMPGRTLLNIYGSSEVSADATCAEVTAEVTIGLPIANTRAYVLDPAGRPAPVGVPGELYVSGDGVALGYHDRAALNAERFLPDPFSSDPAARMFRTGDRVRRRSSGEIEYLGRRDDQVKIRGIRVELGEVRAALLAHPAVGEAAVMARADRPGDPRLVAYVVARDKEQIASADLAAFVRDRLPAAMVPAAFVTLEALPLLPNGKLDRRALPAPSDPQGGGDHVAPRNAVEEKIAAIWAEVLGVERAGVTVGFFDLGGHSLLLARVHDRLSSTFDRPITLVDLLAHPTVASLARLLGATVEEHGEEADERARRRRRATARRTKGGDRG